ncbi:lecithin retinol acyltransferase family protein [Janthinobacterium sp. LB2P49]|uniref:lecithin retinol acyltransferase family protein n=1 Tax=Janthinobacterium sp. LB2P49 TaxID=3424198 RepID=UPI003F224F3B
MTVRGYSSASFHGKEIVCRAESSVGEKEYDAHSNNYEDFFSWTITGKAKSEQVNFVETVAGLFFPFVSTAAQVRKHVSRKDLQDDGGSTTGDITEVVLKAAAISVLPVSVPVLVAGEALRRIFK